MRTELPKKWCIECTKENKNILRSYRLTVATEYKNLEDLAVGYVLVSKHPDDGSCYYATSIGNLLSGGNGYEQITLEEFQTLVLSENSEANYEIY